MGNSHFGFNWANQGTVSKLPKEKVDSSSNYIILPSNIVKMEEIREATSLSSIATIAAIVGSVAFYQYNKTKCFPVGLLKEFGKEFVASLAIFIIFYIGCSYLVLFTTLPAIVTWVYHFVCMLGLDRLTKGASMNPALSVGLWINGTFDWSTMIVHLAGQMWAAQYGFYVIRILAPLLKEGLAENIQGPHFSGLVNGASMPVLGLTFHNASSHMTAAFLVEATITFVFAFAIFYSQHRVKDALTKTAIAAAALRVNMIFTEGLTGANMNPMVAYSWLFISGEGSNGNPLLEAYYQKEYIMVYCVAPMIGAGLASVVESIMSGKDGSSTTAAAAAAAAAAAPARKENTKAPAPAAMKGLTASRPRGRGKKIEEQEEAEVVATPVEKEEEEQEQEEEEKPAPKKASRSRSRAKSPAAAKKETKKSPSPAPAPRRRTSSRKR
jgi:glycerol uptake facilitator-like aquaporin